MDEIADGLEIRRVANGWIVSPGQRAAREFVHIYAKPADLAEHVKRWAEAQLPEKP